LRCNTKHTGFWRKKAALFGAAWDTIQIHRLIYSGPIVVILTILFGRGHRDALRTVLIRTYFNEQFHNALLTQGEVNLQSYLYSQHLIEQARQSVKDTPGKEDEYQAPGEQQSPGEHQAPARDQGLPPCRRAHL
jgi:hypothetical protein